MMLFNFDSSIKLTFEQIEELQTVFNTPDLGWNDESEEMIYKVEHHAESGTVYLFEVNNEDELITLKGVM